MGNGSKLTNCGLRNFTKMCIRMYGADDDAPHAVLKSDVSGCQIGSDGLGAVSIRGSTATGNTVYGVAHGIFRKEAKADEDADAVSDAVASYSEDSIYMGTGSVVVLDDVTACSGDSYDFYTCHHREELVFGHLQSEEGG